MADHPNTQLRILGNTVSRTWRVDNELPPCHEGNMPWMVIATIPITATLSELLREIPDATRERRVIND